MRPKAYLTSFRIVALATLLVALGCSRSSPRSRSYDLEGEVMAVAADSSSVTIAHGEIPGYMEAMTMPFPVKDTNLLSGVAAGDAVRGQITVTPQEGWLSQLEIVAKGTSDSGSFAAHAVPLDDLLQAGDTVPDIALTNQDGHAVSLSGLRSKIVVLNFIYTRCPFPNFCPWQTQRIADVRRELAKRSPALSEKTLFLSISIDPTNDTPAVLHEYGKVHGADFQQWIFAAAPQAELARFGERFGVVFWDDQGVLTHNMATAIVARDGRLYDIFRGSTWTVADCMQSLLSMDAQETSNPRPAPGK